MQAGEVFQEAFSRSMKQLTEESQPITAAVVYELADRCSAGLSQLRGITAMYRMSARPAPTRYRLSFLYIWGGSTTRNNILGHVEVKAYTIQHSNWSLQHCRSQYLWARL